MKKRVIAVLLAVSLVCVMTACGEKEVTGNVTEAKVENVEAALAEAEAAVEETEAEEEEAVVEEVSEVVEEVAEEAAEEAEEEAITIGVNEGNTYENEYFGIGCTLDSDWTLESQEQILARNQLASDLVGDEIGEVLSDAFESGRVITDMVAVNANGMDTVNVGIEKLVGGAMLIDEKQYIDLSEPQLIEALTSMGLENVTTTKIDLDFAGDKHAGVLIEAEYSGVPVYEELAVVKNGAYILCVTAATWQENGIDAIFSNFYAL